MTADIDALIAEASKLLKPATVIGEQFGEPSSRVADVARLQPDTPGWEIAARLLPLEPAEIQVVRYLPGGKYGPHRDNYRGANRITAMIVQLSDPADYTGGELIIHSLYPLVAPTARGAVITFGGNDLHQVRPVLSGIRWSLVAWSPREIDHHRRG